MSEPLPAEATLALAHTAQHLRGPLRIFFELDSRLARLVSGTSEPMLGQMRLAWWRDMLGNDPATWPSGDAVLDGIKQHWKAREASLLPLVNGWEHLLADAQLSADDAAAFANGRCDGVLAALSLDASHSAFDAASAAAWHWALGDLAAKVSNDDERALLVEIALARKSPRGRLPNGTRGLAVLGALGARSLKRGGRPLMEGRGASLIAFRAAITGRAPITGR